MVTSFLSSGLNGATAWGDRLLRSGPATVADQAGQSFTPIRAFYDLAEAYYWGSAYAIGNPAWARQRANQSLPRTVRSVLPLAKPAVDWWPGHVYPAVRTDDGDANRIPFRRDTPPEIVEAVRQAFGWGNWTSDILVYVFHAALLRDVFAEVQVDYVRQKVYPKLWHPRFVTSVEWNDSGDVVAYTIEIPRAVGTRSFLWGKTVTKETIVTLKDGKPFDYDGQGDTLPNPWGFVPAVWSQFRNVGEQHGACVMDGLFGVVDELNGMQSEVDDFVLRFARQPVMVPSKNPDKLRDMLRLIRKDAETTDAADATRRRESFTVLPAPEEAKSFPLLQNLGLAETGIHFDRLMKSLERNLPELVLSEKLQEMSQVTRPGAVPLVTDVQHKLDEVCGNLDPGPIKLGQMCCSIMGELVNAGVFGPRGSLTAKQQKFLPFSLASFERDELDFSFSPRELLPKSIAELAAEALAVENLSDAWSLRHAGLGDGDLFGVDANGEPNPPPPDAGILGERAARQAAAPVVAQF